MRRFNIPDGKIASSINAGTEQNSITRPFTQGKLFDTEEQAVEEAKKEITGWVKDIINSQVETEEAQSLQNIADRVNNKIKEDFKETTSETVMQDKDIIKEEVKKEDVSKEKELEYGSEEKRLAERKARKEKTVELRAQYVTGKKLNEGLNVNKVAIEDNRTDKTEDGYERIKEVIGYKKRKFTAKSGVEITAYIPDVITEIVNETKEPEPKKSSVKEPKAKIEVPETLAERRLIY